MVYLEVDFGGEKSVSLGLTFFFLLNCFQDRKSSDNLSHNLSDN